MHLAEPAALAGSMSRFIEIKRYWCPWPESIAKSMILKCFFFIHFGYNDGLNGGTQ